MVVVVAAAAMATLVWRWLVVVVVGLLHHVISVGVGQIGCGHGQDDTYRW